MAKESMVGVIHGPCRMRFYSYIAITQCALTAEDTRPYNSTVKASHDFWDRSDWCRVARAQGRFFAFWALRSFGCISRNAPLGMVPRGTLAVDNLLKSRKIPFQAFREYQLASHGQAICSAVHRMFPEARRTNDRLQGCSYLDLAPGSLYRRDHSNTSVHDPRPVPQCVRAAQAIPCGQDRPSCLRSRQQPCR